MLDSRKKLFLSLVFTLGVVLSFFMDREDFGFSKKGFQNSSSHSSYSSESLPIIAIYPFQLEETNLSPLARGIGDFWFSWLSQSPSLVSIQSPQDENSHPKDSRLRMSNYARKMGADFLYSGELSSEDGKVIFRPMIYNYKEDLLLKTKPLEIWDSNLTESIQISYDAMIALTERNLSSMGRDYSIDRGIYFQEIYQPTNETTKRYFSYLERIGTKEEPTLSEWEDLAGREELFWNPWDHLIRKKFAGREDSSEARYYLESFSRKANSYFRVYLGKIALDFGKVALEKSEKYRILPFLELADSQFRGSGKTLGFYYAELLHSFGRYYKEDNKITEAKLYFLNSQKVLERLNQNLNPLYIKNKFLLSQVLRISGQNPLSILELEDALGIAEREWKENPEEYYQFLALSHFNLGTMNLEIGRSSEAYKRFQLTEEFVRKASHPYSDIMFYTMINKGASLIHQKKWNEFIDLGLNLDRDLRIMGMESSPISGMNYYNLALAFLNKGGNATFQEFKKNYETITSYSARRSIDKDSAPIFVTVQSELKKPQKWILSDQEEGLVQSFTGKFRMERHAKEIRSRTYTDRLEDHDIFLGELFGKFPPSSVEMHNLRKKFRLKDEYKTGKGVVFIDIGPAIANAIHPAVTSMSLVENFPDMDMVLLDLPSEVKIFLNETDKKLRDDLLSHEKIRILAGDGTAPLRDHFRREGAWVLENRPRPEITNRMIVVRTANSIDVYEPYSKVKPFLENLAKDFEKEDLVLFFNRLLIVKPGNSKQFQVIGSQSIRGFYHNVQSLDRQGQPPFILSRLVLGEDE